MTPLFRRIPGLRAGRSAFSLFPVFAFLLVLCAFPGAPAGAAPAKEPVLACGPPPSAELAFKVLKAAYPEGIVERMTESYGVQCALVNGISVPLAGLGRRDAAEAMDVAATLACGLPQPGPAGPAGSAASRGAVQGFVRCQILLKALYGGSGERERPPFVWCGLLGDIVPFASRAGASAALRTVGRELEALGLHQAGTVRTGDCAVDAAGVRRRQYHPGEGDRSAHGWGIAVDVQLRDAGALEALAAVFGRHGFIWACEGMACEIVHFEYRPEVVAYARLRQQPDQSLSGQSLSGQAGGR